MAKYTQGIQGLDYREGLFLQTRPGLVAHADAAAAASPSGRSTVMRTYNSSRVVWAALATAALELAGCGGSKPAAPSAGRGQTNPQVAARRGAGHAAPGRRPRPPPRRRPRWVLFK